MPELTEAGAQLLSNVRDAAQLALRRIVVDAARASKLPSLTAEQRTRVARTSRGLGGHRRRRVRQRSCGAATGRSARACLI